MRTTRTIIVLQQYDEMSQALFGRMAVAPSPVYRTAIDTCVKALRRDGIVPRLDLLYLTAMHDAQAARLNVLADTFPLAITGSPVFTAGQGYAGDGSAALLTATGYNPTSVVGARQALDSAALGIYVRTAASYNGSASRIDLYTGTSRMQRRNSSENDYSWRMNDGTSANTALGGASGANQVGHFALRRTAADERSLWRNGAQVATNSQASTTLGTGFALFGTTGNFSDAQISFAYGGASLTDAQMASINTILTAYLTAVGAV